MKRIITILTLVLVLFGSVFATSGDKIYVSAVVPQISPIMAIRGALTAALLESDPVTGSLYGETIVSDVDITTSSVTVYIKIVQTNASAYKNSSGLAVKVTPTRLVNTEDSSQRTGLPTVRNLTAGSNIENLTVTASSDNNKVVTFLCKYANGKTVGSDSSDTTIGTFNYTWQPNSELTHGTYQATITMAYIVN